jgi:hypothetical protein
MSVRFQSDNLKESRKRRWEYNIKMNLYKQSIKIWKWLRGYIKAENIAQSSTKSDQSNLTAIFNWSEQSHSNI